MFVAKNIFKNVTWKLVLSEHTFAKGKVSYFRTRPRVLNIYLCWLDCVFTFCKHQCPVLFCRCVGKK